MQRLERRVSNSQKLKLKDTSLGLGFGLISYVVETESRNRQNRLAKINSITSRSSDSQSLSNPIRDVLPFQHGDDEQKSTRCIKLQPDPDRSSNSFPRFQYPQNQRKTRGKSHINDESNHSYGVKHDQHSRRNPSREDDVQGSPMSFKRQKYEKDIFPSNSNEDFFCRMELPIAQNIVHNMIIGKKGVVVKKIIRETNCKKIKLASNGSGDESCYIEVVGRGPPQSTEEGIKAIVRELTGKVENRLFQDFLYSRNYNWCTYHNCRGHNTNDDDCQVLKRRKK